MKEFLRKNVLGLMSIFIAVLSLIVSINVAILKKTSTEILNKPELVIRLTKFEKTGHFLKYSRSGSTVKFEYNLKISNKGAIAAKNVTFPEEPLLPEFKKEKITYNKHTPITIEQGETVFAVSGFEIQFNSSGQATKMIKLIEDKS